MISGLMEWSRNIVCFSIFAVLIKNLLPGEKYTSYIRLYIGFMMLLVFFTPILKILDANTTLQYLTEILGGTLEIKEDAFLASINENSNYERQKKEYSKILEESVVNYLSDYLGDQKEWQDYIVEKAEVNWEELEDSEEFGTIMGVAVYLKKKEEFTIEQKTEGIVVEPITIEVLSKLEEKEGEEGKQIKQVLAEFYHLSEENIAVRITN